MVEFEIGEENLAEVIELTEARVSDSTLPLSPDGNYLPFATENGLFLYHIDSGQNSQVSSVLGGVYWSPNAEQIAISGASGFIVVNISTGMETNLTALNPRRIVWSSDNTFIAFNREFESNTDIYTVNVQNASVTQLTDTPSNEIVQDWSPDGSMIAFVATDLATDDAGLYTIRLDTDEIGLIANSPEFSEVSAKWSPDGNWLAYLLVDNEYRQTEEMAVYSVRESTTYTLNVELWNGVWCWLPDSSGILGFFDNNPDEPWNPQYSLYYLPIDCLGRVEGCNIDNMVSLPSTETRAITSLYVSSYKES
jgi:Tol biopolymer transport system component